MNGDTVNDPLDVFDHETAFQDAAKNTLKTRIEALKAKAFTADEITSERPTPRVEILFQVGEEANHQELTGESVASTGEPEKLANTWRGVMKLGIYVTPDESGNAVKMLRKLRAALRWETARWKKKLDAELPLYNVLDVVSAGCTPLYEVADKGIIGCTLSISILFGLIPGCLKELAESQD